MPSRSYNEPTTYIQAVLYGQNCTGPENVSGPFPMPSAMRLGGYVASSTPHFKKLKRSGKLLGPNAYRRYDYTHSSQSIEVGHESKIACDGTPTWLAARATNNTNLPVLFDHSTGQAIGRENLWENPFSLLDVEQLKVEALAGITPDLDVLTSLAEAHKTVDMVLNARRSAKNLIFEALKGGKSTARAAGAAWLQWRYGWQQLERDIKNLSALLREPFRPVILTNKAIEHFSQVVTRNSVYDGPERRQVVTTNIQEEVSVNAVAAIQVRAKTLNALIDVPVTLYELIPFSWVADWFVSIGDCLKAWSVLRSAEQAVMSVGYKRVIHVQVVRESTPGYDTVNYRNGRGSGSSREAYSDKVRIPSSIPSLIPQARVRLTSRRILDAASLCATRLIR